MKKIELKEQSTAELKALLTQLLHEQFTLRTQKAAGQLEQTHLFSQVRRSIARVKTLLNSRNSRIG